MVSEASDVSYIRIALRLGVKVATGNFTKKI